LQYSAAHMRPPSTDNALVLSNLISANIAINDIALKLHSLGYISSAESIGVSLTTFTQCAPKATEFGEITQSMGLLCRSRSFNVTECGTDRKLICDFLL